MVSVKYIIGSIYSIIVSIRNYLYKYKVLKINKFNVPIVSVGNITVGGSCKTPMVQYLAQILKSNQWRPCIISRGYKRKNNHLKLVSINNNSPKLDDVGDEAYMLSKHLPEIPIIVADKKSIAINYAIHNLNVNIIIIDDGFQSLYINRDIDIVMINSLLEEKDYRMFPLGKAREKINSIKRADLIITTKNNLSDMDMSLVNQYNDNQLSSEVLFSLIHNNQVVKQNKIKTLKLVSVCGIADPESFIKGVESLEIDSINKNIFYDHHRYSANDITRLMQQVDSCGCDGIITTYKDYYKLKKLDPHFKIYILKMDLTMNSDILLNLIRGKV